MTDIFQKSFVFCSLIFIVKGIPVTSDVEQTLVKQLDEVNPKEDSAFYDDSIHTNDDALGTKNFNTQPGINDESNSEDVQAAVVNDENVENKDVSLAADDEKAVLDDASAPVSKVVTRNADNTEISTENDNPLVDAIKTIQQVNEESLDELQSDLIQAAETLNDDVKTSAAEEPALEEDSKQSDANVEDEQPQSENLEKVEGGIEDETKTTEDDEEDGTRMAPSSDSMINMKGRAGTQSSGDDLADEIAEEVRSALNLKNAFDPGSWLNPTTISPPPFHIPTQNSKPFLFPGSIFPFSSTPNSIIQRNFGPNLNNYQHIPNFRRAPNSGQERSFEKPVRTIEDYSLSDTYKYQPSQEVVPKFLNRLPPPLNLPHQLYQNFQKWSPFPVKNF